MRTAVIPTWERWLETLDEHTRRRQRAIFIWDAAPTHTAIGRTGDRVGDSMFLYQVPAETTSFVSPNDVGGVFRSIKSQARRDFFRQDAEQQGDYWDDYAKRLSRLWTQSAFYSRQLSTPQQFYHCGYSDSRDGGWHLCHSRLRKFMVERGFDKGVNEFISPARMIAMNDRRMEDAKAAEDQNDLQWSTDDGEWLHENESASEEEPFVTQNAVLRDSRDRRERCLLNACINQVRKQGVKKKTPAKELIQKAIRLRKTIRAPWDKVATETSDAEMSVEELEKTAKFFALIKAERERHTRTIKLQQEKIARTRDPTRKDDA